jgi:hypothetical protein
MVVVFAQDCMGDVAGGGVDALARGGVLLL